jgi:hypothetical protein
VTGPLGDRAVEVRLGASARVRQLSGALRSYRPDREGQQRVDLPVRRAIGERPVFARSRCSGRRRRMFACPPKAAATVETPMRPRRASPNGASEPSSARMSRKKALNPLDWLFYSRRRKIIADLRRARHPGECADPARLCRDSRFPLSRE